MTKEEIIDSVIVQHYFKSPHDIRAALEKVAKLAYEVGKRDQHRAENPTQP